MVENELVTLGVLFFFAILGGVIATRFKQPAVLGLLLVGAIIGPNSLNFVKDANMIGLMAEFGAILMLFVIGLEFSVTKVFKIGFKAVMVALFKVGIMFFMGYETGILLGLGTATSMFIGVILSFTSTVVVVKILEQKEMFNREEIPLLMAVLIIEDVLAVIALTFFSGVRNASASGLIGVFEHLAISMTILVVVFLLVQKIANKVIGWLMKNSGEEVITFIALGLCAGFAYLAYALDLSPSAGAFLAGSIIASLKESKSFEKAIIPYTLTFTSLFFIAVGTMVNFNSVGSNLTIIGVLVVATLIARFIAVGLTTYVFANFKGDQTFFSSIAMFSVGEFSLLVAKEGMNFNLGLDLVTISSVIIFITAIFMSLSVNYSHKLYLPLESQAPKFWQNKLKNLSGYIKSFFEQIDTESTFTNNFKKKLYSLLFILMILFFTVFGFRRLVLHLALENLQPIWIYGLYLVAILLISTILAVLYKKMKDLYETLITILVNLDYNRNSRKTNALLKNMIIGISLILFGLFSPVLIFLFSLPDIFNIGPIMILIAGAYFLRRVFKLLNNYTYGSSAPTAYRKLNLKMMKFEDE